MGINHDGWWFRFVKHFGDYFHAALPELGRSRWLVTVRARLVGPDGCGPGDTIDNCFHSLRLVVNSLTQAGSELEWSESGPGPASDSGLQ
jgi:hypothetical protein